MVWREREGEGEGEGGEGRGEREGEGEGGRGRQRERELLRSECHQNCDVKTSIHKLVHYFESRCRRLGAMKWSTHSSKHGCRIEVEYTLKQAWCAMHNKYYHLLPMRVQRLYDSSPQAWSMVVQYVQYNTSSMSWLCLRDFLAFMMRTMAAWMCSLRSSCAETWVWSTSCI